MSDKNKNVIVFLSVVLFVSISLNVYMLQEKATQRKNNDDFLYWVLPRINKEVGYILEDTYDYFVNNSDVKWTSIERRLNSMNYFLRDMNCLNSEFDFNISAFSSYFSGLIILGPDNITDYDREALRQLANLGSVLKLPNSYANQEDVWLTKQNNKLIPTEKTKKHYAEIQKISIDTLERHRLSKQE